VHSNGLLAEMGAWLAARAGKPFVLTLYGTEIWHYAPKRGLDLFTRAYRAASHVTFYSHGLQTRAVELGLARRQTSVVYPPVAPEFEFHDSGAQLSARKSLDPAAARAGQRQAPDPLAGQRFLLEALGEVVRHIGHTADICGPGRSPRS
jgi:hypothetical protein